MKKHLILIAGLSLISACSTMQPPRYSISVDNIQELKKFDGAKAEVSSLNQEANFDANCRLMGPIEPADGLSIPQFISKAINDEFKMAGIHSTEGAKITGSITKIEFSSVTGLTNGYWDIGLNLNSSNGESLSIDNKYTFKSGFDAITACNATADALAPAVQDLIKTAVTHPEFGKLIRI
ncbi:hypothetical protein KQ940_10725 [Marinobacterium sp. D7]|uniref:hypothetical protein n=1 Tax=Marinobacterium ramblicola TaxID=2849041 RepID=UPI001C2DC0A7|nr:hypothetical protein [Marinobacterium ramblicola]MBV1788528.1 hypothetical protein [Marinobacterium ramblicola]